MCVARGVARGSGRAQYAFFLVFFAFEFTLLNKPTVPKNGTHHTVAVIKTTTRNFEREGRYRWRLGMHFRFHFRGESLFALPFRRERTPKTQTKARVAALLYLSTC